MISSSRFAIRRPAVDRVLVLSLVSSLLALQPLVQGRLAWRADGLLHFHRLAQLDRALRHGTLYPRWLPDMGLGFGFPLFNYYAPLSYYLVEPLRLAGLSVSSALLVSYALALLTGGLGAYLWVSDLLGRMAGLIAAIATVYAPYTLYNTFQRGALAEAWGLAWLPLILWALRRLALQGRPRDLTLTALTYTALVLSHNILALVCSPLLVGYAFFLWLLHRRSAPSHSWCGASETRRWHGVKLSKESCRRGGRMMGALALGLGLSAFFWGPALFEKDLVQIHQLYAPSDLYYRNNFSELSDLLTAPAPADPALVNPSTPRSLGWPQLALACVALLTVRRWQDHEVRAHLIILALTTLGLTLMTLPLSTPVWDRLPLLRFVQFPWRFLGPAGLTLAALAGAGASQLPRPRFLREAWGKLGDSISLAGPSREYGAAFWPTVAMLAIVLFALTWLFPTRYPPPPDPTPADLIRFEGETGALGTTSAGDYLPIRVHQPPAPDALLPAYQAAAPEYIVPRLDETSLPAEATIVLADYDHNATRADVTFDSPVGFTARFNWYFFPGWRAELDGQPHELQPQGPHGLIAVDVPPGHHHLTVALGDTPLRRWANLVSLVSLIALVALARLVNPAKTQQRLTPSAHQCTNLPILPLIFVALAPLVLKVAYLDHHDTPFRHSRFDGQRVTGVQVPLQVNFGDEMALLGYDLPAAQVQADGTLKLTLYWRVLRRLDTNYSVTVHLIDDQGWRYGQQDKLHLANYPTSRWELNEYARDAHRLMVWPGTPPGEYTLLISVYELQTGRRLDLLDANGAPVGTTYTLTQIRVTRPARPPHPDDLEMERSLSTDLGGDLTLLGLDLRPAVQVNTGERLALTLYWRAGSTPTADYIAWLRLVTADGAVVAEERAVPGRADYPTSAWHEGDIMRDSHSLLIPATTADDVYTLRLDLLGASSQALGSAVDLATVTVHAPERTFDWPSPSYTLAPDSANLGQLATLLGYDLSAETLTSGQTFHVTLYWQARATPDTSFSAFVHLLDAAERIYAQRDQVPDAGERPTTGWVPDEIIHDSYTLTLAEDAPPGDYRLEVGLYDSLSGDRLPLIDANGDTVDTRILLPTQIQVR